LRAAPHGQRHAGAGPAAGRGIELDAPAMLRHDPAADREAEARTLPGRLRAEERLEESLAQLGRDAGTIVFDLDDDRVLLCARTHFDASLPPLHRLGRIL